MAPGQPIDVTLYERPDCHLCEEALHALAPVIADPAVRLTRVNVEAEAALEARFGLGIPVVAVAGVEVTRAPLDLAAVRTAISAARER